MRIYELLQIGEFHTNHCEDYIITVGLGDSKFLCAIMDGCSNGIDSHLPSTITGKLLRKIGKEIDYLAFLEKSEKPLKDLLKEILRKLFEELKIVKNHLLLRDVEFYNTLNLLLIDGVTNTGESLVIGDGMVCFNGQIIDYDQNNHPDYVSIHLKEDFDKWYEKQTQRISMEGIKDISITSDGIFSFQQFSKIKTEVPNNQSIINFLIIDKDGSDNENMLQTKMRELEKKHSMKSTDDLGIIRIINSAH